MAIIDSFVLCKVSLDSKQSWCLDLDLALVQLKEKTFKQN